MPQMPDVLPRLHERVERGGRDLAAGSDNSYQNATSESKKAVDARESWCRGRDSNPRPPHYECGALPAELPRHTAEITRDNLFRQPLVAANCYGIATIWVGAPLLYRLLRGFVNAAGGVGCGSGETKQSSGRLKGGADWGADRVGQRPG